MVKIDYAALTDKQLRNIKDKVERELDERSARLKQKSSPWQKKLVRVPDHNLVNYTAGCYITATTKNRFKGGFWRTLPNENFNLFAKTKTGILYRFSEFDRKWHAV